MAIVSERYVQALLNSSRDSNQSNTFEQGLKEISSLYITDEEFRKLLLNPCVSNEEKLNVLKTAFSKYCEDETFLNFLKLILSEKRIGIIESISNEYSRISDSLRKELNIKIIVAETLSDNQINDIADKYKKLYNANIVNYTVEVDESIIGGVKVIIGNKIYDGTLKTQLKKIF